MNFIFKNGYLKIYIKCIFLILYFLKIKNKIQKIKNNFFKILKIVISLLGKMKVKVRSNNWPATMEVSMESLKVRVTLWWEFPPKLIKLERKSWADVVAGK